MKIFHFLFTKDVEGQDRTGASGQQPDGRREREDRRRHVGWRIMPLAEKVTHSVTSLVSFIYMPYVISNFIFS